MSDNKPGVPDVSTTDNPRGEMLSALLDGEASDFEARRLIQSLTEEDEQSWRSYSLIQQAMHSSSSDELDLSIDISSAVSAAIADEPALSMGGDEQASTVQAEQTAKVSYLKPVMGFAAAAAFAFVSVINLESFQSADAPQPGFVAQGNVSASQLSIQSGTGLSAVSAQAKLPVEQTVANKKQLDQEKLNAYIQRHAEQSAMHSGQGLMPAASAGKNEQ